MQTQITDPHLKEILEKLKPFGFNFHGYDEGERPLVVAPNGQVVDIDVAISFANEKISEGVGGNIEEGPAPQQIPESNVESNVEASSEKEKSADQREDELKKSSLGTPTSDFVVPTVSPQVTLKQPQYIKPYGDGFDIKSFDPGKKGEVVSFVEKNIKKNNKSSDKWLATMFKKFVEENKLNSQ